MEAMHQLDLPRTYATIINCGAFAFDLYPPNFDERSWLAWLPDHKPDLPQPSSSPPGRREAADGTVLEMRYRQVAFNPLDQTYTAELRVEHFEGDRLIACEEHGLTAQIYFKSEVLLMLKSAGFHDVQITGGLEDRAPRPWEDERLMLVAIRS